jgi:predicted O-methyltransferase YrrM
MYTKQFLKLFLLGVTAFLRAENTIKHYNLKNNERSTSDILELYGSLSRDAKDVYNISLSAFNRMPQTAAFVKELKEKYKIEAALETGTWRGGTTKFFSCIFDTVYSIEIDSNYYSQAKLDLSSFKNTSVILGDSGKDLLPILERELKEKRLLCYLDAHWYSNWPLKNEIRQIAVTHRDNCILMIDDIKVPGRPDIQYDCYVQNGERLECSLDYVKNELDCLFTDYEFFYIGDEYILGGHKLVVIPKNFKN